MVEQRSAATNFQHGDTYLSPAESTAVRYAVHERLGSELFSYAVDFLDELLLRKVPGVEDNLYRRYRRIFGLLNVSVAPLLIEVPSLPLAALSAEGGGDPGLLVEQVRRTIQDHAEFGTALLQQTNFRLRRPVPVAALKLWLMSITDPHPYDPGYKLYEVSRLPRLRPDNR
jgi:hypothetical protein